MSDIFTEAHYYVPKDPHEIKAQQKAISEWMVAQNISPNTVIIGEYGFTHGRTRRRWRRETRRAEVSGSRASKGFRKHVRQQKAMNR